MNSTNPNRPRILSIVGCLLVQLCVGIIYLWSVFKTPVAESFGCAAETLNMVSSFMLSAFVVGCMLGGFMNDRSGPRLTCITGVGLLSAGMLLTGFLTPSTIVAINFTYAVLGGLGSGIAYSACVSCVQKWLPHKRGLATGLAVSAFGLSTVVFAPAFKALMAAYTVTETGLVDFQRVFFALAVIFLSCGLIGCFMIRTPNQASETNVKAAAPNADIPLGKAVRTMPFWCIFLTVFFINGTWNLTVPVLYDLGIERGLTAAAATFAVSFTGIPNAIGRLLMASLSDKMGRRNCIRLLSILTAVAALLMIFAKGYAYIAVVAVIAFAYGGPSSVNAAMTTDYFGSRHSGTNYGVIMLALGLSSLFFNMLSATVLHGNLSLSFVTAAISAVIPLILMSAIGDPPAIIQEDTHTGRHGRHRPIHHGV